MKIYRRLTVWLCFMMVIYLAIWHDGLKGHSNTRDNHESNHTQQRLETESPIEITTADDDNKEIPTNQSFSLSSSQTKIIYIWNRQPWLFSKFGPTKKDFKEAGCAVHNCRLVDSSSHGREKIPKADSILFTIRDFFGEKPKRLSQEQIWVIWHNEAPLHDHPVSFSDMNDYFNLTYSYMDRPDTDIYRPASGLVIPRPTNLRYHAPSLDSIRSKSGRVAWIVSNCNSKGQRTQYVKQLSKYIPVDIYGKCGKNCSRESDFCFKKISREYKFYLAAESMYCEEYITEKMFRPLSGFIVPIALGGADYSAVLPERSFIDVRDFNSPKELAKYLKRLDNNDDEYMQYFDWKAKYMAVSNIPPGLCDLCKIVHTPNYPYKSGFKFDEYWDPKKYCKEGDDEKRALHLIKEV